MRAVRVTAHGGPEVLEPADVEAPVPGPGEVRIDVAAAGVNFADVEKRRGTYPDGPAPPYVPGIEVAGTVDAAGEGVDRQAGEAVVAVTRGGGYAGAAVAPGPRVFDAPSPDPVEAAAVPVRFLTAHEALHARGDLDADDRVLVHAAAGGVGSAAVQLAARAGAEVFGTASTPDKRALAADLGADHALGYTDVAGEVAAITDGDGVDLVLDGVGGEAFYAGLEALAPFGRIVVYGVASGDPPAVATPRLVFGNRSVRGYHLEGALDGDPGRVRAAHRELAGLLDAGAVEPVVGATFDLAAAAAAHELLESRGSTGKVVLEL